MGAPIAGLDGGALVAVVLIVGGRVIASTRPFADLIRLVRAGGPGTEGVVATATRPALRGRRGRLAGPAWGEWQIEAYAIEDTDQA